MSPLRMAAAAANFDRDLEADLAEIERLVGAARAQGVRLLALPEAALGGYLVDLDGAAGTPPALTPDGPEMRRLATLAGDVVVAVGYCEDGGGQLFNSAICVTGDGVLGHHRKVHQPLRRLRHARGPARHDDLLRQGLPGIGTGIGARRGRDRAVPVGLADQPHES